MDDGGRLAWLRPVLNVVVYDEVHEKSLRSQVGSLQLADGTFMENHEKQLPDLTKAGWRLHINYNKPYATVVPRMVYVTASQDEQVAKQLGPQMNSLMVGPDDPSLVHFKRINRL